MMTDYRGRDTYGVVVIIQSRIPACSRTAQCSQWTPSLPGHPLSPLDTLGLSTGSQAPGSAGNYPVRRRRHGSCESGIFSTGTLVRVLKGLMLGEM